MIDTEVVFYVLYSLFCQCPAGVICLRSFMSEHKQLLFTGVCSFLLTHLGICVHCCCCLEGKYSTRYLRVLLFSPGSATEPEPH